MDEPLHCFVAITKGSRNKDERDEALRIVRERRQRWQESRS